MDEKKQPWLLPEVGESIKEYRRLGYGKKREGKIYEVPQIVIEPAARELLNTWPIKISSRSITIIKPYANFAHLEPSVIFDFEEIAGIKVMEFTKVDDVTVKMTYEIRGNRKEDLLILHENGTVQHKWGINIGKE